MENPGIAAVLSFVFNGLGQVYNGQIAKGLVIMLFSAIAMTITLIGAVVLAHFILSNFIYFGELIIGAVLFFLGVITIAILGIYNIYDAYNVAKKKIQ
ncbi:MAG: hypothetical protein AMJ78_01915 [Omnitrophica WOR_2 bacterium SM23_29]|nr:MAG: hypothetical protein AMJ78_01915 [Omnitrophica WOR_2 bacterium SM23_29]